MFLQIFPGPQHIKLLLVFDDAHCLGFYLKNRVWFLLNIAVNLSEYGIYLHN